MKALPAGRTLASAGWCRATLLGPVKPFQNVTLAMVVETFEM